MTEQQSHESQFVTAFFSSSGELMILEDRLGSPEVGILAVAGSDIDFNVEEMAALLKDGPVLIQVHDDSKRADALTAFPRQFDCSSAAYIPIHKSKQLTGMVFVGTRNGQSLDPAIVTAFQQTIDLASLNRAISADSIELASQDAAPVNTQAINEIANIATNTNNLDALYKVIHEQVRNVVGDHGLVVALYDKASNSINIPYLYEDGNLSTIETFPLGEGLTSILIRSREPLMLVEDTMNKAIALGAKVAGKPARSWLGVPLITQGDAIGAIIVQDLENDFSFDNRDLEFMTALANQVSGTIHNISLLDQSRQTALQFETAAEIAKDISSSLDLDELLRKAVDLIRSRFDFYHASIFLKDPTGEYVVIREATGDAGAQLKRSGHKLGVGSKSVVGYAAGNGEKLIVNDTTRDATYYPNPLLPDTRSEAAIPLIVGERIVGVLDVQSTQPFAFSDNNLRTLQILADQLAIAVVNTELFAETQEHLAQHRLLHHITTTAASGTTLDEALQSAVNGLQVTLGGDRVSIMLADREKKVLEVKAMVGYGPEIFELKVPIGSGISGWAAKNRRTLRVGNVREDARYVEGSGNTNSELAIPMIYRSELLGVLNVESEIINAYSESDEELLGTLGGSLAAIIANARLLEQIRAQAERERVIFDITDKIRRTTDLQTILTTTASELTRATGASRVRIKVGALSESQPQAKAEDDAI